MAALRPPFEGRDLEELFRHVQNKPIPSIPKHYSRDLTDLIQYCLNKKASKRPTTSELLKHAPFQKYFIDGFSSKELVEKEQNIQPVNQKLLQTIKLPSDLKKLKDKLPDSKY